MRVIDTVRRCLKVETRVKILEGKLARRETDQAKEHTVVDEVHGYGKCEFRNNNNNNNNT